MQRQCLCLSCCRAEVTSGEEEKQLVAFLSVIQQKAYLLVLLPEEDLGAGVALVVSF
jgi:hypothetical protein